MFDRVAIIGDADLVFPLRVMGIKVYSPKDALEAKRILIGLEKEHIALCFIHESLIEPTSEERERLMKKFCPVLVGFSDYRKITDYLADMLRDMAITATGSDSLVRRRGRDEQS